MRMAGQGPQQAPPEVQQVLAVLASPGASEEQQMQAMVRLGELMNVNGQGAASRDPRDYKLEPGLWKSQVLPLGMTIDQAIREGMWDRPTAAQAAESLRWLRNQQQEVER